MQESNKFYEQLDEILASEMSGTDDGLGILVNNVSAMSENPVTLEEMSSSEVDSMMLANMHVRFCCRLQHFQILHPINFNSCLGDGWNDSGGIEIHEAAQ